MYIIWYIIIYMYVILISYKYICTHRHEDGRSTHLPGTHSSSPPGEGLNYPNAGQLSNSVLPHTPPGAAFFFFFSHYFKRKN